MPPQSIDEVLAQLDQIISRGRERESRLGYFAALYRDVTAKVKADIEAGEFQDGARMERLDVAFARRYLDAMGARDTQAGPPRVWAQTFQVVERWRPLILQHLLLGMNAHINLDLGVAAVEVAPKNQLSALKSDFEQINQVLGSMIEDVQKRLTTVSPWTGVLDRLGGQADEVISNFCLVRARDDAWAFAQDLASSEADRHEALIQAKAQETARRTEKILCPGGPWIVPVLTWIRLWEEEHIPSVISALSQTSPAA